MVTIDNPTNYPDPSVIAGGGAVRQRAHHRPHPEYVGNIMPMCQERRGEFKDMQYLDTHPVESITRCP